MKSATPLRVKATSLPRADTGRGEIASKRKDGPVVGAAPKRQKTPPAPALIPPKIPIKPLSSKPAPLPIKQPISSARPPAKPLGARLSPRLASKSMTPKKAATTMTTISTPATTAPTPTPKKANKTPQKREQSAEELATAAVEAMFGSSSSTAATTTSMSGCSKADSDDESFFVDELGGTYADISARREAQRQRRLAKRRTSAIPAAAQTGSVAAKTPTKSPSRATKSPKPYSPRLSSRSPAPRKSPKSPRAISKSPVTRKSPRLTSPASGFTQVVAPVSAKKAPVYSPVRKATASDEVFLMTDGLSVPGLSARHEANRRQRLAQRKGF